MLKYTHSRYTSTWGATWHRVAIVDTESSPPNAPIAVGRAATLDTAVRLADRAAAAVGVDVAAIADEVLV